MRRIRGLVETHARTRANSHFLLLGAAWLIGYLLLLQLDFLGHWQHHHRGTDWRYVVCAPGATVQIMVATRHVYAPARPTALRHLC